MNGRIQTGRWSTYSKLVKLFSHPLTSARLLVAWWIYWQVIKHVIINTESVRYVGPTRRAGLVFFCQYHDDHIPYWSWIQTAKEKVRERRKEGKGEGEKLKSKAHTLPNAYLGAVVLTSLVTATPLVMAARYDISRTSFVCYKGGKLAQYIGSRKQWERTASTGPLTLWKSLSNVLFSSTGSWSQRQAISRRISWFLGISPVCVCEWACKLLN